jgi:hypothetical protein
LRKQGPAVKAPKHPLWWTEEPLLGWH